MNGKNSAKLVVIGQGYVGLPLSMRAVEAGYSVVGIDFDERRIHALNSGVSYVEDISNDTLKAAGESGRYSATTSYEDAAGFDYAVVTVPTPLKDSLPDLTFIESSGASLAPHLVRGATVILESTTYPGTTQELLVPILEAGSGLTAGTDFYVGYSPERIDPGNQKFTFKTTPKIVSGIDAASLAKIDELFSNLVDRTVPVSSPREAEMAKLLENTFRHVNIALVNELAVFANDLGVNVWEAIDAAATKPFGFMKFTPGPGVGGHCLPIDPSYLSWKVRTDLGRNFRFVELANDINEHMPDYVLQRASAILNDVSKPIRGSRVTLVGIAYKKDSGDIRESPSLRVIELLQQFGAEITAVDPHVEGHRWPAGVVQSDLTPELIAATDLAIIITDHSDIDLTPLLESDTQVFDTRNSVTGPNVHLM